VCALGEVPSSFLVEQEKKALTFLVVSVNGDSIASVDALLALPSSEYDSVVREINKIQNPTTPEN
jgi:hypothetical protein